MAQAMIMPKKYFFDKDGNPLAYGKVYTYQAGTTIDKVTYTTENGDIANPNPVILNGEGYASIYLDGSYNIVVDDQDDNNIWTEDPVSSNTNEEWVNCEVASYVSPTSFLISGNVTSEYEEGRRVRIDNGVAEPSYSTILSSSFSAGNTTVVVNSSSVQPGILGVCTSLVGDESTSQDLNVNSDLVFDTVQEMVDNINLLPDGKLIKTLGNKTSGVGGAKYIKRSGVNPDGISNPTLSAGGYAEYQTDNGAYVASQLGATHDNLDSSTILNHIMTKDSYIIDGSYSVSSSLNIQNGTSGEMRAARINALSDDFQVITGTGKHDFEMTGNLKVKGPGMGVGTGVGIYLFDCYAYKMDCNPEASYLGEGIIIDGTTIAAGLLGGHRGRQGRWTNPTVHNCIKGVQTLRRAEYSLWSAPQVTQCTGVGWTNSAGNTNVVGGNIQDNQNGVLLQETGTTNANHGMFTSVNINHNIGYNLRTENTKEGMTFNGCHFYGDSASAGTIELISSNGINIVGGIIDAKITIDGDYVDTATEAAWNKISGNLINTTYTVFDSINGGREKTIVTGNYHRNGDAWGYNDRALTSVQADTVGGSQAILDSTNTIILFNSERDDNRLQYDDTTGVFTALFAQSLTINFTLQLDITGGSFIDGFCSIELNNNPLIYKALAATGVGGTLVTGDGVVYLALQAGDTLAVKAFCNIDAGTISVTPGRTNNIGIKSTY